MAVIPLASVSILEFRSQVTPKCHDVLKSQTVDLLDLTVDHVLRAGYAGQVRHSRHAVFFFNRLGDIECETARPAAGSIRYAHERRLTLGDLLSRLFYTLERSLLLRRKYLKRQRHALLIQNIDDLHV